ncbi:MULTISPECIES: trigger factor [Myroides]|uniref:Trigger factor n=1 Tax=Myroides odoratimimus CIP 101113 TaxID=883154 RepID=A0AAV3F7I6_9FLAO|nr:trigger factor [Myroides odoratimimus]EHO14807.1 trigger factor [Myroides odoratimimus CIP 101113]EKB04062.1 trigger factor [Myroides odoratimimus CCUG 3837]EPH09752.1 trigger factor [Myroides odoratimimus CCUG 12700]MCO7722547.1 trigger factor [Myroides odoratimimus]MDM1512106.1 trigger factor [Myroides odoratimimus]
MNITRNNVDALNAIVTIELAKEDYQGNVDNVLSNYKKNANVPGFRKGAVPMSLIVKQYGKAVLFEEVNKILQEKLSNYLVEEKLDILGNPLPVANDINWDADVLKFDFELGLAPEFSLDLEGKNKIKKFKVVADDAMLDEQVEFIQKQYGKMISKEVVEETSEMVGTFANEEEGINNEVKIAVSDIRTKTNQKKFIGKKVGDQVTVSTKGLFEDDHKLMEVLAVDHDKVHGLEIDVIFTINEINETEKAELNQELFDKLFGEGVVTSVEQLKEKIKEDAEKQFASQADQKFLNDVYEHLLENTSFELPAAFLTKWLMDAGETPMTAEEAAAEYTKSEKGLRYQLVEGKVMSQYDLQLNFEEIKEYTTKLIKDQMAQFGQMDPEAKVVEDIVARVMTNQDEVRRISEQVMNEKVLALFNDKVKAEVKEVSYKDFVKEMYGE